MVLHNKVLYKLHIVISQYKREIKKINNNNSTTVIKLSFKVSLMSDGNICIAEPTFKCKPSETRGICMLPLNVSFQLIICTIAEDYFIIIIIIIIISLYLTSVKIKIQL